MSDSSVPPVPNSSNGNILRFMTVNVLHQAYYARFCKPHVKCIPLEERAAAAAKFFSEELDKQQVDVLLLQEWSEEMESKVIPAFEQTGFKLHTEVGAKDVGCAVAWRDSRLKLDGKPLVTKLDNRSQSKQSVEVPLVFTGAGGFSRMIYATSCHMPFARGGLLEPLSKWWNSAPAMSRSDAVVVIGGDLNTDVTPKSGLLDFFNPSLWAVPTIGDAPKTCQGDSGIQRLDHFFASVPADKAVYRSTTPVERLLSHTKPEPAARPDHFFSDHAAVIVDIDVSQTTLKQD